MGFPNLHIYSYERVHTQKTIFKLIILGNLFNQERISNKMHMNQKSALRQ